MKSPQQEVYDWVYMRAIELVGEDKVWEYLPMESDNAAYPFVLVGDSVLSPSMTKTSLNGSIAQTVDVWGDATMRLEVSTVADQLLHAANTQFETEHYRIDGRRWPQNTSELSIDSSVPGNIFHRAFLTLNFEIL